MMACDGASSSGAFTFLKLLLTDVSRFVSGPIVSIGGPLIAFTCSSALAASLNALNAPLVERRYLRNTGARFSNCWRASRVAMVVAACRSIVASKAAMSPVRWPPRRRSSSFTFSRRRSRSAARPFAASLAASSSVRVRRSL